jgi:hypothetical protein
MVSVTGSPVTDETPGIHKEMMAADVERLTRVQYNDDEQ